MSVDTFPMAFGRYQLVERLAVGGMAELFKARVVGAHGFQKPVVIKKILPHLAADASFVNMFIDEANITARLDHPKIAQVLELGKIEDQLYIAMEFVDGVDVLALLRALAQRKQTLPARLAAHVAHEILDALDYAHQARDDEGHALGIVHRDISPSNVLISRRGDIKLADFGIAHAVERQQKTQAGTLKGKYGYMSPEQVVGGDLDGRSDLFSVAIVLAEMLMGRRLFTAPNDLDVLLMVRDVRLDRLEKYGSKIEPELKEILLKAFQREPKDRFHSAGDFRDELAEFQFGKRQRVTAADVAQFIVDTCGEELKARGGGGEPSSVIAVPPPPKAAASRVTPAPPLAPPPPTQPVPPPTPPPTSHTSGPMMPPGRTGRIPAIVERRRDKPATVRGGPEREDSRNAARPATSDIPIVLDLDIDEALGKLGDGPPPPKPAPRPTPPHPPTPAAKGSEPTTGKRDEMDFSDISSDLGLQEQSKPKPAPKLITQAEAELAPQPAPPVVGQVAERTDEEGDFSSTPPIKILYRLAVDKSNGLLVVEISAITKEIYFVGGVPEFVSSNVARELFGEYLVSQKVISAGELAMALAMMPHFGGKLGDTLVGLGLMKPLDVFRHLTRQVRDKVVDVCTWQKGKFRWYRNKKNPREAFPLGLDALEVIGAGASALPPEVVGSWAANHAGQVPIAAKNARVVPEAFRLGSYPREVYNRLDGRLTMRDHVSRFTSEEDRLVFLRTLYLLVHTELASLG